MRILIDSQKAFEVEPEKVTVEGTEYLVLSVEQTYDMLNIWRDLDVAKRVFSWPGAGDEESLMICWYGDETLVYEWVSPFWDGVGEYNAHSLDAIARALPVGALQWGEQIGEPAP